MAAVLGVYALVLQIGLGIVAGLAGGAIARERSIAGEDLNTLALQICSPAGLIQLAADDGDETGAPRNGPVCPGCLVAHAGPLPPIATVSVPPAPVSDRAPPAVTDAVGPAPAELITALNPRAPPTRFG